MGRGVERGREREGVGEEGDRSGERKGGSGEAGEEGRSRTNWSVWYIWLMKWLVERLTKGQWHS